MLEAPGSLALATSAGQAQSHKHLITNLKQIILKSPAWGEKSTWRHVAAFSLLVEGIWDASAPDSHWPPTDESDSKKAEGYTYRDVNASGNQAHI